MRIMGIVCFVLMLIALFVVYSGQEEEQRLKNRPATSTAPSAMDDAIKNLGK